jgi:predicted CopG family antitoxin
VITLGRYATISVLREVKELLSREKGDRDWSSFLLELYREARRGRAREAFSGLRDILGPEDLESIARASRKFREGFRLG